jgi:hypothetical protein
LNLFTYQFKRPFGEPYFTTPLVDTVVSRVEIGNYGSVALSAPAVDENGTIASYQWEKVSGVSGFVLNGNTANATIYNLPVGDHVWRVRATDNSNVSGYDTINIKVQYCKSYKKYTVQGTEQDQIVAIQTAGYMDRTHHYGISYPHYPVYDIRENDTLELSSLYRIRRFEAYGFGDNFDPKCPFVVKGDAGIVRIELGMKFFDCLNVKVTGRDAADTTTTADTLGNRMYHIRLGEGDELSAGVTFEGAWKNVEIEKLYGRNLQYAVQAKTDPPSEANGLVCDPFYTYVDENSWILENLHIHHNYWEDIDQDGHYLANTDPNGDRDYVCGGVIVHTPPLRNKDFHVHHEVMKSVGRYAIIAGGEFGTNRYHDNIIENTGWEWNQSQGSGISPAGSARNLHIYNNRISKTFLYGIFDFAGDSIFVENNVIDSSGFVDVRSKHPNFTPAQVDSLANWINGGNVVVQVVNQYYIKNIYQGGINNIQSTTKPTLNNYMKTIYFRRNFLGRNSRTDATASQGSIEFAAWGAMEDWRTTSIICGNTRMDGTTPINVYQFWNPTESAMWPQYTTDCTLGANPSASAGADQNIVLPFNKVRLQGTATPVAGKKIINYEWVQVAGSKLYLLTPYAANTDIYNVPAGTYTFRLMATQSDLKSGGDDITITVGGGYQRQYSNFVRYRRAILSENAIRIRR